MTAKPNALVLAGDGINCEGETAFALELAGFRPQVLHVGALLASPERLQEVQLLTIPGGFSFGDEIASGKVLAVKMRNRLGEALHEHIDRGRLVLGICNGFQVLVQLGLLPNSDRDGKRVVSLLHNAGGRFIDRWVELEVMPSLSPFLTALKKIHLPVRHGEGRLAVGPGADERVRAQAAIRYAEELNGSFERVAALTNPAGNVLGLMPHPEAFVRWTQHPAWGTWQRRARRGAAGKHLPPGYPDGDADGLSILKNAARAFA